MGSIYDVEPDETFIRKLREYEPLLWAAAKRFEIKGVLLPEDLYQEGMIALEQTFEEHWKTDPDSPDFTRSFKSRLFHRMSDVLRRHKTQSRDWRREVRDGARLSPDATTDPDVPVCDRLPQSVFPPPDSSLELRDLKRFVKTLEADLKEASLNGPLWGSSADDALEVLRLVVDDGLEIPDEIREAYERMPSRMTNMVLAEITGWDVMKVRRALKRLRKHARQLAGSFGLQPPKE